MGAQGIPAKIPVLTTADVVGKNAAEMHLRVVLLETSGSEKNKACEVSGLAMQAAHDSIDEQRSSSQAVPHGPEPVGLLRLTTLTQTWLSPTAAAAPAAWLAAVLALHPADSNKARQP